MPGGRSTVLIVLAALTVTSCSLSSPGAGAGTKPVTGSATANLQQLNLPAAVAVPTMTTEQPGWVPVTTAYGSTAIDTRTVTGADGHAITVFRFHAGHTRFALHAGSSDPPVPAADVGPNAGAAIGPDQLSSVIAAFNGGFKSYAGAGGFELDSHVIIPLRTGMASLAIDADGSAHVGIWGVGLPFPGEQVVSVRQNLAPLIVNGQPSPQIADVGAWGATLGGGTVTARSSLGEDGAGNLLFAAGMAAYPSDLAGALISAGAVSGMQLDINPEWVQLDAAPTPGGTLAAGVPGQNRPSDQYLVGWTRDFVTVVASRPMTVRRPG